jgi:hypothetical protein
MTQNVVYDAGKLESLLRGQLNGSLANKHPKREARYTQLAKARTRLSVLPQKFV